VTPIRLCRQVRERADSDCPVSISSLGSNSVRLEDGARVGQIGAAITEQRTPLQRAATVSRVIPLASAIEELEVNPDVIIIDTLQRNSAGARDGG
jgi:hypothetical protein